MSDTKKILLVLTLCGISTYSFSKTLVRAVQGSITEQSVEAIVNAANPQLAGGGGVCGGIFKAAGWANLQKACDQYPMVKGIRCPVGQARITDSFQLSKIGVKKIIHAVGPDARIIKDPATQRSLLESAYTASLQIAVDNKLSTVAFPFISSGIYAVNHELAAQAAITAVKEFVKKNKKAFTEVRFVLLYQDDFNLFESLLNP